MNSVLLFLSMVCGERSKRNAGRHEMGVAYHVLGSSSDEEDNGMMRHRVCLFIMGWISILLAMLAIYGMLTKVVLNEEESFFKRALALVILISITIGSFQYLLLQ